MNVGDTSDESGDCIYNVIPLVKGVVLNFSGSRR